MIVPNSLHPVQYDANPCYDLYGVLVHSGYDTRAGHYYCYIKNSNGIWHEMNDSTVPSLRLPSFPACLGADAYSHHPLSISGDK